MLLAGFISWWYGAGWRLSARHALHRLSRTAEFFSMALLIRTLFAPFRQISAGSVRGGLNIQFRAFLDRLVSRFVGFFVRTGVLFAGLVAVVASAAFWLLWLVLWPLIPLMPVIMIVLGITGWPL